MKNINMIISLVCAIAWTYKGITGGFTLFGVCATVLWWIAAVLFTYSYFKRKKQEENENG